MFRARPGLLHDAVEPGVVAVVAGFASHALTILICIPGLIAMAKVALHPVGGILVWIFGATCKRGEKQGGSDNGQNKFHNG